MTRTINTQARSEIRLAILEHAFGERFAMLALRRHELAHKVYSTLGGQLDANNMRQPWVTYDRHLFRVYASEPASTYAFDLRGKPISFDAQFRAVFGTGTVGFWSDYPADTPKRALPQGNTATFGVSNLYPADLTEYQAIDAQFRKVCDDMVSRSMEIAGILERVRTVKRLTEIWPEAVQFVPDTVKGAAQVKLPATRDLNAALGLK